MGVVDELPMDTSRIGDRSEAAVIAALLKAGKTVLKPFGNAERYDLVIDEGDGRFVRVQCKTARLVPDNTSLRFKTCSVNRQGVEKHYNDQIEFFGVYAPQLDKVYLVPIDCTRRSACFLRLTPPKRGQTKDVKLAADFELQCRLSSEE